MFLDAKEEALDRALETYEKVLGVLTPQQQEKLKEAFSKDAW